jgi:YggT family protein
MEIDAMAGIIKMLFQVYTLMLFVRIISSWVPEWRETKVIQFIAFYTDPYLDLFRRVVPPLGGIDFSPILAFISLSILESILLRLF